MYDIKNINSMLIYEHNRNIRKAVWVEREREECSMRESGDTAAIHFNNTQ